MDLKIQWVDHSILLWRLRWKILPTIDRLLEWGAEVLDKCQLCDGESIEHIFYRCTFSQWLLEKVPFAASKLINHARAMSCEALEEMINDITTCSPTWGLTWTVIGILSWTIWNERNLWFKTNAFTSKETLLQRIIKDTSIIFREDKIKKDPRGKGEGEDVHIWGMLML